ncbi:SLC13 family permease [soil metagenome]
MSGEAWLTLVVITITVIGLSREMVAPAVAVLGAVITLLILGVITPQQALAGFSNPAPITVAALYVVARAVEKTGALQPLVSATLDDGDSGRTSLAKILLPTAGASAFLNNTPIVAMLAPQVADWAERRGRPASWYLMPISFAAMLGGTVTLIGTSTNLVVSGLLEAAGHPPLGMFEITRVGLPIALAGVALLILLAPVLLPDRRGVRQQLEEELREFVIHMEVEPGGALDGKTVEAGGLRHLQGVFLAEIDKGGQLIAPAAPTTLLEGGDRLTFVGRADLVVDLQARRGLRSTEHRHLTESGGSDHTFFEAVVSATSLLIGRTLKEVGFRERYQAAVLAIHRSGERVRAKLGEVPIHPGDTLVLMADPGFRARWRDRNDFLLVSDLGGSPPATSRQALVVALITLGIVVAAGAGLIPILNAALLGAVALVLLGILTPNEARGAIDFDVIIVIAAAFGLGAAMEVSGLAQVLSAVIVEPFRALGPVGILFAIALATALFTELITNNAAAVLLFPIATAAATAPGLDPRPFAIVVAVAASASFLTPIGYQTNMMVYGPGGYRFTDYARLGLPLNLLVIVLLVLLVPLFWSL